MATSPPRKYRPGRGSAVADVREIQARLKAAEPTNATRMNDARRDRMREKLARKISALDAPVRDVFVMFLELQGG